MLNVTWVFPGVSCGLAVQYSMHDSSELAPNWYPGGGHEVSMIGRELSNGIQYTIASGISGILSSENVIPCICSVGYAPSIIHGPSKYGYHRWSAFLQAVAFSILCTWLCRVALAD